MDLGIDPSGKYRLLQGPARDGYISVEAIDIKTQKSYSGRYLLRRTLFHSPFLEKLQMEYEILGSIIHPYIQQYIETTYDTKVLAQIVESEEISLLEYYRYDLPLAESISKGIFYRLADAVSYLHSNMIIHLDIRPEKVYVCENRFKLGGFLSARYAAEDEFVTGSYGTPNYQAPEIFTKSNFDGRKADVWACGIFLLSILTGKLPYGYEEGATEESIAKEINEKENIIPEYLSDDCKSILDLMLQKDPTKRATMAEIKEHPWLSDVRRNLQSNPTDELPAPSPPAMESSYLINSQNPEIRSRLLSSSVKNNANNSISIIKHHFGERNVTTDSKGNFIIIVNDDENTALQATIKDDKNGLCVIKMYLINGSVIKFNEIFISLINEIEDS